jgi:hypothetical protein
VALVIVIDVRPIGIVRGNTIGALLYLANVQSKRELVIFNKN